MSIESSKKTLKVVGILSMIVSILNFIGTLILAVAGNYLINVSPETLGGHEFEDVSNQLFFLAVLLIGRSFVAFIDGLYSYRSAKNRKYVNVAFYISIFALAFATIDFVSMFLKSTIPPLTFLNSCISVAACLMLSVAAYTIKNYKEEPPVEFEPIPVPKIEPEPEVEEKAEEVEEKVS